jgi:protocatechuate 3,4-dioxygenase beta subunit
MRALVYPLACLFAFSCLTVSFAAPACPPTEPDEIGPFYKPDAPVRSRIGTGYVLIGTVRSSTDCRPVPKARIEFWHAGPKGEYDDAHRATIISDVTGKYRLQTDPPVSYLTRPPHIHILVEARGFHRLITQHYPARNSKRAVLDLVLVPATASSPRGTP